VHPPERLLSPTLDTFKRLWQASQGKIKVMTIAPELPGALEVIGEAAKLGVCVSLGHSDATLEQAKAGIAAGGRHATHTFNAMRPLGHRDPGIVGEVLSNVSITADIIADGVHVHPSIVRVFLQAKGVERTVLVTDGTAATGMPDGRYMLGSLKVEVQDGKCLHDGKLAGSVLTLDRAVRNAMEFAGIDLQQALRLATVNAARAVNISRGVLQEGCAADIAVLTPSGNVRASLARGAISQ
jgi:N-acetylglucosamine-6-phosphate deacetylase